MGGSSTQEMEGKNNQFLRNLSDARSKPHFSESTVFFRLLGKFSQALQVVCVAIHVDHHSSPNDAEAITQQVFDQLQLEFRHTFGMHDQVRH